MARSFPLLCLNGYTYGYVGQDFGSTPQGRFTLSCTVTVVRP
jgi:hypothetical protein